jgi:hypothetical protein
MPFVRDTEGDPDYVPTPVSTPESIYDSVLIQKYVRHFQSLYVNMAFKYMFQAYANKMLQGQSGSKAQLDIVCVLFVN